MTPNPASPLEAQLTRIEGLLMVLVNRQQVREFYSVEELARLVGRHPYTVREWARQGRIRAEKKISGRGANAGWAIGHEECLRYQREGLLPANVVSSPHAP